MQTSACLLSGVICRRSVRPIRLEFSDGWRVYLYVLLEISPNLPSTQPYSFGKSVLTETNGAGAPFPHCCAAHGASGGPRAPPEVLALSQANQRIPALSVVRRPTLLEVTALSMYNLPSPRLFLALTHRRQYSQLSCPCWPLHALELYAASGKAPDRAMPQRYALVSGQLPASTSRRPGAPLTKRHALCGSLPPRSCGPACLPLGAGQISRSSSCQPP